MSLCLIAASALLASAATAAAQSSQEPKYVDVGHEFRESGQVTMGADLLTPEEKSHFTSMRQKAKTRAEKDRVEAEETALLNERVSSRINQALNQPLTPGAQRQQGAERPDTERGSGSTMPGSSGGMNSGGMGSGGMGSGGMDSGGMGSSGR
jgi:hypothetical protein